jgi:hypothetical protein
MLELYALPKLPPRIILQQDEAPPHFCHQIRNYLDREMAMRWIGRGGPIAWIPTLPNLSQLDFILWRYAENIVYQIKINDLQHLKARIRDVAMVTPTCFKQRGTKSNIVWTFVVPPSEPTLKYIEKVTYSEKTLVVFLCNGVSHKCV